MSTKQNRLMRSKMVVSKIGLGILVFFMCMSQSWAQGLPQLSLDDALKQTIENNPQLQALKQSLVIAENNVDRGNAGMLPTVSASASTNLNVNNTDLTFGDGRSISANGARSLTNALGLSLNYVLFDGFAMFNNYERLKLAYAQTDANTRFQIEQTIVQVVSAYFATVLATKQLQVAQQAVAISADRYKRAQTANELGSGSGLELLSAQVDLNADSVNYLSAAMLLQTNKQNLSFLMGRKFEEDFEVDAAIPFDPNIDFVALSNMAIEKNAALKVAEQQAAIANLDYKLANAAKMPTIALSAGYNFSNQQNDVGLLLESQQSGYNVGLALNYNLFAANRRTIAAQNAEINKSIANLSLENAKLQLDRDLQLAYADYSRALSAYNLLKSGVTAAQRNFERAKDLFQYGSINNTQFREAQLNLINVEFQLNNAAFEIKRAEINLFQLAGSL